MKHFLILFALLCSTPPSVFAQIDKNSIASHIEEKTNDIYRTKWVLQKINNQEVNSEQPIYIRIDDSNFKIHGNNGCNIFQISIKSLKKFNHNPIKIKTRKSIATNHKCVDSLFTKDCDILSLLTKAKFTISKQNNDELTLLTKDKTELSFVREDENPMLKYMGKYAWKLIQYKGDSDKDFSEYLIFDFQKQTVTGYNKNAYFEVKFSINKKKTKITFYDVFLLKNIHTIDKQSQNFISLLSNKTYY
ncbi:META domain-containing protein, partial [Myroides sp. LoEW2-1]